MGLQPDIKHYMTVSVIKKCSTVPPEKSVLWNSKAKKCHCENELQQIARKVPSALRQSMHITELIPVKRLPRQW